MRDDLARIVGFIAVCMSLLIGFFGIFEVISKSALWSGVGPAWVQAVGSVVGIAIAIGVPMHQRASDKRERAQNKREVEASQAFQITKLADELLLYAVTARNLAGNNFRNYQPHLPELTERLAKLSGEVSRLVLSEILNELVREARHMQMYEVQLSHDPEPYSTQGETYRTFEVAITGIQLNAMTTSIGIREYAKLMSQV